MSIVKTLPIIHDLNVVVKRGEVGHVTCDDVICVMRSRDNLTLPHKIRDRVERVEKMKVHREQCRCVVGQVIETCRGMLSVETTLLL